MKSKILIVLLLIVCILSCTACNILDMASQTTARSNAEMSLTIVRSLNNDVMDNTIYVLVFGEKEVAYSYVTVKGNLRLFDGELPVVDANDLVFTNPNVADVNYDYSASQKITTNEDIVKNIVVVVPMD